MSPSQFPHFPDPNTYKSYEAFREAHSVPIPDEEKLARWAQHQILVAISNVSRLRQLLIFKGGNALRAAYGSVRATKDLDFSIDSKLPDKDVKNWLERALTRQSHRSDIELRVQSFKPKPKNPNLTRRTWVIKVGYALRSNTLTLRRLLNEPPQSPSVIPLEISENEAVGIYANDRIVGAENLNVSTVENIIAEKLRALLQQPIRKRYRPQDVFDIAYQSLRAKSNYAPALDLNSLRRQFSEKCKIRDVSSSFDGFKNEDVWGNAARDYANLETTVLMGEFLSFEEAQEEVEKLLDALRCPTRTHYP